jgi:long-chain acyl-CoA synthetase
VKDLFKTSKGKYVAPAPIEDRLVMHSRGRGLLRDRRQPGPAAGAADAQRRRREARRRCRRQERARSVAGEHLKHINEALDPHEQLDCLVVVTEAWTVDNDLITPTFKVKRNRIEDLFAKNYDHWVGMRKKIIWHKAG